MNSPSNDYRMILIEDVIALYHFLKREPINHHIPNLVEAVNHICELAEHELATRDSKTT